MPGPPDRSEDDASPGMTVRRLLPLAALAALLSPGLAACDDRGAPHPDERAGQAAAAAPPPSPNAAEPKPKASVMRPSVVNEVAPVQPPPPPQPFEATVHFDEGAALSNEAKAILARVAAVARGSPQRPIVLRGHTDSRGDDAANKRVSERRAEAVRHWLAEHGVAEERMTVIGLGEGRPVAPNTTLSGDVDEAGRRKNRRVDIVIQPPEAEEPAAPAEQPPAA